MIIIGNNVIMVQDVPITVNISDKEDYICITDIAKAKSGKSKADDTNFKPVEFDGFRSEAGLHTFTPSVSEWIEKTGAIWMYVKKGKYGGTYAHKDIAFEFASVISPVFKLYLIKEFQRLKEIENNNTEWNVKRILTKNNYLIHTDTIKNYILPNVDYYKDKSWLKYAEEADILNVIIFKSTALKWRKLNPELAKKNNMRDYATINELTVLSNLESHNAELIKNGKNKGERFYILSDIANYQLNVLNSVDDVRLISN